MNLSVIVCSHNPRTDYLSRVMSALQAQTLPLQAWELFLVDNASASPLAGSWDLSWHPNGHHLLEQKLGLTRARFAGIRGSSGEHIIFVDDDNVLSEDYLQKCLGIGERFPQLGCWGGELSGEFEVPPAGWKQSYLNWLAVRSIKSDLWSNLPFVTTAHPSGAGMCIRRRVAEVYSDLVECDPMRKTMGRAGARLWSSEDADINYTANHLGLGNGLFKELGLTHLIPAGRLEDAYLLRLIEDSVCSSAVLHWLWGREPMMPSRSERLFRWYRHIRLPAPLAKAERAKARGHLAAIRFIAGLDQSLRSHPRPRFAGC